MIGAEHTAAGLAGRIETTLELLKGRWFDVAKCDNFVLAHRR